MAAKTSTLNPATFPNEEFELYSIPAFDEGEPVSASGALIGSSKQVVFAGDVLLSKIVPHIRRAWVVGEGTGHRKIASSEWIVFRGDEVHAPYLSRVLTSDQFHLRFMSTVAGVGGSLMRARPSHVATIPIPLPPLEEQQRIAEVLDRADALRAQRESALALLDTLTLSIFYALEASGELALWPQRPLVELTDADRPICYGILMPKEEVTDGVRYVRVRDFPGEEIQVDSLPRTSPDIEIKYKRSRLRVGDVLVSIRGSFGRVAIVPNGLDGANITQDTARVSPGAACDGQYLAAFLRGPIAQDYFRRVARGVAVRGVNIGDLRKLPVPVPPLERQREISEQIVDINELRAHHRAAAADLDELFSSLEQRAFRGDL
jgi:type I restriction enzyme S subunit